MTIDHILQALFPATMVSAFFYFMWLEQAKIVKEDKKQDEDGDFTL